MSLKRKLARSIGHEAPLNSAAFDGWARRHFSKYGVRAVAIAAACRMAGLRDMVVPVTDVAECIPTLAGKAHDPKCQYGGMYDRAGARSKLCGKDADVLVITDSGLELFFCEAHGEERVVRVPT